MSGNPPRSRVFVAGHNGLVGSAITRALARDASVDLVLRDRRVLDLRDGAAVQAFFAVERPSHVYLAAGKVGGIGANDSLPADFIRDNLAIQTNVIDAAWRAGVSKLLFLGSSCIYPRDAAQPIREEALLSGPLEPTNQWYAIAKIAGIKMCQAYRRQYGFNAISVMPTNLYGPGDNFSRASSHVLPALLRRFHEAKLAGQSEVVVWGSGAPRREFLHVDDLADALLFLMASYDREEIINVGTGEDLPIADLVQLIRRVVGYSGSVRFDTERPDGTPRKQLDVGRIHALGWHHRTELESGVRATYEWFVNNMDSARLGDAHRAQPDALAPLADRDSADSADGAAAGLAGSSRRASRGTAAAMLRA